MQCNSGASAEDNLFLLDHDDSPAPVCKKVNNTVAMKVWKRYYCCVPQERTQNAKDLECQ